MSGYFPKLLFALSALLMAYGFSPSLAQQPLDAGEIVSEAQIMVKQGRQPQARALAIEQALSYAVQEAAGKLLQPAERQTLGPLLRSRVIAGYKGYVSSYRVLKEGFLGNRRSGYYWIRLAVTVRRVSIKRLLDGLRQAGAKPAAPASAQIQLAMVAVDKEMQGRSSPVKSIKASLQAKGYRILMLGTGRATARWRLAGRCWIKAKGRAAKGQGFGATVSCKAELSAVGSTRSIVTAEGSAIRMEASAAVSDAGAIAAVFFAQKVEQHLLSGKLGCTRIWKLVLHGPLELSKHLAVLDAFERQSALVRKVRPISFFRGGVEARMEVDQCEKNLVASLGLVTVKGVRIKVRTHKAPYVIWVEASPEETPSEPEKKEP